MIRLPQTDEEQKAGIIRFAREFELGGSKVQIRTTFHPGFTRENDADSIASKDSLEFELCEKELTMRKSYADTLSALAKCRRQIDAMEPFVKQPSVDTYKQALCGI